MNHELTLGQAVEASHWVRPDLRQVPQRHQAAFASRCDALQTVIQGSSIRLAARQHAVNRVTLTTTVRKAFERSADGAYFGYRACLPFAIRTRNANPTPGPIAGQPYALGRLIERQPIVATLLQRFDRPLPPGRLPPAFKRLLTTIRTHLKEQGMSDEWPLNQADKGRRAFTRYVRIYRRERLAVADLLERSVSVPSVTTISKVVRPGPYDRFEFDAHSEDVNHYLARLDTKGNVIVEPIKKVWVLVVVDVASKAVMAWKIVYGQGYSALDVAQCFASIFRSWEPKALLVPNMRYQPGAMMPSSLPQGVQISGITAFDNAKAHHAKLPLTTWVREMHGVINLGPTYVPEVRPAVENFFGYFEAGALRLLPGGYQPARELGAEAIPVSEWRAIDHPLHVEAMEQLMDVLITAYNASPQTALQGRSPLEVLQVNQFDPDRWVPPPRAETHLKALTTQFRMLFLRGGGRGDKAVHVNFANVAYRHPLLDRAKEYIGQCMQFYIDLEDLRTIVMVDSSLQDRVVLRAEPPWDRTQHDLTTRQRILRRVRSGELEIRGAQDAIAAYASFVLRSAASARGIADEHARLLQLAAAGQLQSAPASSTPGQNKLIPVEIPRNGPVSFNKTKDFQ